MTKTVWKFPLGNDLLQLARGISIEVPVKAELLHCGFQHRELTLWMLVDPEAREEDRNFRIVGTGHQVQDSWKHAHSFLTDHDSFVWHLFEVPKDHLSS